MNHFQRAVTPDNREERTIVGFIKMEVIQRTDGTDTVIGTHDVPINTTIIRSASAVQSNVGVDGEDVIDIQLEKPNIYSNVKFEVNGNTFKMTAAGVSSATNMVSTHFNQTITGSIPDGNGLAAR